MPVDTQDYNIKGIYGMNGSGKSGIVTSVDILRNLLINENYLNNPMVQKHLDAIINKNTKELFIGVEFLVQMGDEAYLYQYEISLKKGVTGKYNINLEKLSYKGATSKKDEFNPLIEIKDGDILKLHTDKKDPLKSIFIKKTTNLLSSATVSALFMEKIFATDEISTKNVSFLYVSFLALLMLGKKTYVYLDQSDNHTDYFLSNMLNRSSDFDKDASYIELLLRSAYEMDCDRLNVFSIGDNLIPKDAYEDFAKTVRRLQDFLQIFKSDLKQIDIDKKKNGDIYVCNLNMVYETFSINAEFESTGIILKTL